MSLVRWDPLRDIADVFDRYSKSIGWPRSSGLEAVTSGDWSPRVDIVETEKSFQIKAELPEIKKEDVKVTIDNGALTVQGERKQEKEEKGKKFHRVERHFGSFMRSFTLPENVDQENVTASFKDGMLTLELKKVEPIKPKGIEVRIN